MAKNPNALVKKWDITNPDFKFSDPSKSGDLFDSTPEESLNDFKNRIGVAYLTEPQYKHFLRPKMKASFDEYKNRGLDDKSIRDELRDEYYYEDLINEIMGKEQPKKIAPRGFVVGDDGYFVPREYSDEEMKNGYNLVLNHLRNGGRLDDNFMDSNPDLSSDMILSAYRTFKGGK